MGLPYVSVIVPAFNASKTIQSCVNSLLKQGYPQGKYEVIVVDNGSTDNTWKMLQNYRGKIILMRNSMKNSYRARNTGIMKARGDILLFTDADCVAGKDWMPLMVRCFQNPSIKIAGGGIQAAEKRGIVQKYCDLYCHTQESYYRKGVFASSNMAVRHPKEAKTALFDVSLPLGADFEFCSRIVNKPSEIVYEPKAVVCHHYSDSMFEFLRKHFVYGKSNWMLWERRRRMFFDVDIRLLEILKRSGMAFALLRTLQVIAFCSGVAWGYLSVKRTV